MPAIGLLMLCGMLAHHGGTGGYDASRPLYLRGRVIQARYGHPHGQLRIEVPADLTVPGDLPGVQDLRGHDAWTGPPAAEGAGQARDLLLPPDITGDLASMSGRPQVGDEVAAVVYRRCDGDEYSGELRVQMLYAPGGSSHRYRGTFTRFVDRCLQAPRNATRSEDDPPYLLLGGGAAIAAGFVVALIRLRTRRQR